MTPEPAPCAETQTQEPTSVKMESVITADSLALCAQTQDDRKAPSYLC